MKEAETILEPLPALKHVQQEIIEKRRRVETKQFTVALFGAFSAGKSSFANALLGEKVLPVSPIRRRQRLIKFCRLQRKTTRNSNGSI